MNNLTLENQLNDSARESVKEFSDAESYSGSTSPDPISIAQRKVIISLQEAVGLLIKEVDYLKTKVIELKRFEYGSRGMSEAENKRWWKIATLASSYGKPPKDNKERTLEPVPDPPPI